MDMKGEYRIAAPRPAVWAALNDVEVLKAAIPGCDTINKISDNQIEATVTAKVGPVKATFKGVVTLSDLDPPNGYTISGEGKGGVAGFAKGGAKVKLRDDPESGGGTILSYDVDASVGGKLAQIGARLIDSTAKKLADEFFAKFGTLAAAKAAELPAATLTTAPTAPPPVVPAPQSGMTPPSPSATLPPAPSGPTPVAGDAALKTMGPWLALLAVVIIAGLVVWLYG